eukprot:Skav210893  [mRNA]  locus=scaffold1060:77265:80003:- [translate_table: standard]
MVGFEFDFAGVPEQHVVISKKLLTELFSKPAPKDLTGPVPERPFKLLDNGSDVAAPQPPHFQSFPLRPEQQRSLQWMVSRENLTEGEIFSVEWRRYWTTWESNPLEAGDEAQFVPGALVSENNPVAPERLRKRQGKVIFRDGLQVEVNFDGWATQSCSW